MKKNLKKLITMMLITVLSLSVCACGSDDGGSKTLSEKKENPASTCFSTNTESIWYYIEPTDGFVIGKDMKVKNAYVFGNGKCSRFDVNGEYTLGDFSKMNDEEIVEMLKEHQSSVGTMTELTAEEEACTQLLDSGYLEDFTIAVPNWSDAGFEPNGQLTTTFENMSVVKNSIEAYQSKLEEVSEKDMTEAICTLAIYTDSTGNNTSKEQISFEYNIIEPKAVARKLLNYMSNAEVDLNGYLTMTDQMISHGDAEYYDFEELCLTYGNWACECYDYLLSKFVVKEYDIEFEQSETKTEKMMIISPTDSSISNPQIYDSYYGGFICEGRNYLLTRTGENTTFTLDEVGTEGVAVDPK